MSMMNGYHFEQAKTGANEYLVRVNGSSVISGSTYASALDVYKYIEDSIDNARTTDVVCLVKEYDAKTKSYPDFIMKNNQVKIDKLKKLSI